MKALLFVITALCATLSARGDYLFTWHFIYPQFQKFNGSFEVTDVEMQPGASFGSDLFHSSILFTGSTGAIYHAEPLWSDTSGSGSGPPLDISMVLHDDSHATSLSVDASDSGGGVITGRIYEFFSASNYHDPVYEDGYWTYEPIPEPSAIALLGLATVAFLAIWKQKTTSDGTKACSSRVAISASKTQPVL